MGPDDPRDDATQSAWKRPMARQSNCPAAGPQRQFHFAFFSFNDTTTRRTAKKINNDEAREKVASVVQSPTSDVRLKDESESPGP